MRATTVEYAPTIDRAKLRDALRTIGEESVFYVLDEAIDLLPPDKSGISRDEVRARVARRLSGQ